MSSSTVAPRAARDHAQLGRDLRTMRRRAGLGGVEAARRAGMSQSKISRLENCRRVPTPDDISTLCQVYDAAPGEQRELLQLAVDVREVSKRARITLPRGAAQLQANIARMDSAARLLRSFSPGVVLGILQTRDYARINFATALEGDDLEQAIAARDLRKDALDNEDKQFVLVMTEGALRWQVGDPQVMADQVNAIAEASRRPNVRLGIIPWTTPVRIFCGHSFDLFDSTAALVGLQISSMTFTRPEDIGVYEQIFTDLEQVASFGEDARRELARIAGEYRLLG